MTQRLFSVLAAAFVITLTTGCQGLLYRPKGNEKPHITAAEPDQIEAWQSEGTGPEYSAEDEERRWKPIYFAYDQSTVGATEREKLAKIYDYLSENREYDLLIEGHCDERGSEEYNRTLGEHRAMAVLSYLQSLGLSKSRMHTLSFGEERPALEGLTEKSFRLNRRAELVVISAKKAAALEK